MKTILWTCDTCWTEQELIVYDNGDIAPALCHCCYSDIDTDAVAKKLNEDQKEEHDCSAKD